MLCEHCKKNQATKSYEQIKNERSEIRYYCLDCYYRLFIAPENPLKTTKQACSYCGTTVEELKKRNLVGCAKCYSELASTLMPVIVKVQKNDLHTGTAPDGDQAERVARRCDELKMIVEKLNTEKDFAGARAYTERLILLQEGTDKEEDFVWRKHPLSFNR